MGKRLMKCLFAVIMMAILYICIWGLPVDEARISVKANNTNVNGTFTGI